MRRALLLAVVVLLLAPLAGVVFAEADLVTIRRSFLTSRDTLALEEALGGTAADRPGAITDARLAALAAHPEATTGGSGGRGYDALPSLVAALRRLDLDAATSSLAALADGAPPAALDRWSAALIATRRGEDRDAIRLLRTLPGSVRLAEEDAFRLALFGAALPPDDRLFLAGIGTEALLASAADGDLEDAEKIARRLAALDPDVGAEALCLAARGWERRGDAPRGDGVLSGIEASWVARQPCLQLERAVGRWRRGRMAEARAYVRGLDLPAGQAWLSTRIAGLADGARPPPSIPAEAVHVPIGRRASWLLARFATAAGVQTTEAEVDARALALGLQVGHAGFAARLLAERELQVMPLSGSPQAADLVLSQGHPFLLYRIGPRGDEFGEIPFLVWAKDPVTGFYVGESGDLRTRGLVPPGEVERGRMIVALPPPRCAAIERRVPSTTRRLGGRLLTALEQADGVGLRAAEATLAQADAEESALPAYALYRGYLAHRRYHATQNLGPARQDRAALGAAQSILEPLLDVRPPDAFVLMVSGQGSFARRQQAQALELFERAQAAAPHAAVIARTRYRAYVAAGDGDEARGAIDLARRLAPLDVIALYHRGRTRQMTGDLDAARADLWRIFDRQPQWHRVPLLLVALELEALKPRAALLVLAELVKRAPELAGSETILAAERAAEELVVQRAETISDLRPMLESRHAETRRHAAYALSRFETGEAEAQLRRLLTDVSEAVRVTVLRVYMRPWLRDRVEQDAALGRQVLALLRSDASPMVRGAAAGLLSLIRQPWAANALAAALSGAGRDKSAYVRSEAAAALARHDGRVARRSLVGALDDPSLDVRRAAIRVLFRIAATYRGYDAEAAPEARAKAVAEWRAWAEAKE